MRRVAILVGVLSALLSARVESQENRAARGEGYALLVAVQNYDPKTLHSLEFTENDINGLAAVLEGSGYRRENITILTQTVGAKDFQLLPMGKNIRAQLGIPERPGQPFKHGLALGALEPSDRLVVAFAGHGVQFQQDGDSFFCPMDADLADESSLIRFSDVAKAINGCGAGFKLLLVDACHNNPQIRANRAGERPVVDLPSVSRPFVKKPPGGSTLFFSCSAGEVAFEDPDLKHGVFFDAIIQGLGGAADRDGDGIVDVNELTAFAPKRVARFVARKYRVEQTVEVVNHVRGAVAVVNVPRSISPKEITNAIGMKLMRIPAGEFWMGAPDDEPEPDKDEKPRHRVRITKAFYLGATEVTQRQYWDVMGANPSYFSANGGGKEEVPGNETGSYPVEQVSWYDAVTFCNKLSEREGLPPYYAIAGQDVSVRGGEGYRLPTEAEWEYACRAGTTTPFAFGDRLTTSDANFDGNYTYNGSAKGEYLQRTSPVGSYRPNAWGLFDMHGNVWEWCWDGYDADYYKSSPGADPSGPLQASTRVFRGGGWDDSPGFARSAFRGRYSPEFRGNLLGFRVARVRSGE